MATALGQHSQSLSFANTFFDYDPNDTSALRPLVGGFVGAEYAFNHEWAWQFGFAFYQGPSSTVVGEEVQAPVFNPEAINTWDYRYKILSSQLLFENKLLFTLRKRFHPYVLLGLGESFNYSHKFQVTPQNPGEIATAIFKSHTTNNLIYTVGFGLDTDLSKKIRLGVGYRHASLGKYNLGKGMIDTGPGGEVFSLPALKSGHAFNNEILIQLTYLL